MLDSMTLGMSDDVTLTAIVFGVGGAIAIIAILAGVVGNISGNRQREMTKREVAAYVAEGSMTPEDAERIVQAGGKDSKKNRA